jgi:hypothetical protein
MTAMTEGTDLPPSATGGGSQGSTPTQTVSPSVSFVLSILSSAGAPPSVPQPVGGGSDAAASAPYPITFDLGPNIKLSGGGGQ